MTSLGPARDVLKDPVAAWRLLGSGREGLHRLAMGRLLGLDSREVDGLYSGLLSDPRFLEHLRASTASAGRPLGGFARPADLYVICRSLKPRKVVETGVASGISSAHILQALEDNSDGRLYSIDLPNADSEALLGDVLTTLPEGSAPGWVVPEWLRPRWDLRLGRSADILPQLADELGTVDLFLHDSEHSYENMMFEFGAVWPRLVDGGLLLSDDVNLRPTRGAFYEFAEEVGRRPERIYSGFGAVRK